MVKVMIATETSREGQERVRVYRVRAGKEVSISSNKMI